MQFQIFSFLTPEQNNIYVISAYILSLVCLLMAPSKMRALDNIGGSIVAAATGIFLWPFFLAAATKPYWSRLFRKG